MVVPEPLLRQSVRTAVARSALRSWKPVIVKERSSALLSFADFRKQIPRALAQKKEYGIGGGSMVDPVMKIFR